MVVVTDIRGRLGVFRLRFQLRRVRDVGLADDTNASVNGRRSGDGLGLSDAFQRFERVYFSSFEDGRQVLLLRLQDELGLRAGLGADRRECTLVPLDLCPLRKSTI